MQKPSFVEHFVFAAFALFLLQITAFAQTDEQHKESAKVISRVFEELERGNIDALAQVKALPGEDAVAGLLLFFMQNHNLHKATPRHKAIAEKSAQYISELPQSEAYFRRMYKKEEGRRPTPDLAKYRQAGLNCLSALRNEWALKMMFDLMDETDLDVPVRDFSFALAKMGLQRAPYGPTDRAAGEPDAVKRWLEWWGENAKDFVD